MSDFYDLDGNGFVDAVDTNLDGYVDAVDSNSDGYVDVVDSNFDGAVDAVDTNGDGYLDTFDTNLDGVADTVDSCYVSGLGAGPGTGGPYTQSELDAGYSAYDNSLIEPARTADDFSLISDNDTSSNL